MPKGDGFSTKTLGKSQFHLQTDWSGNGLASQFWQLISALRVIVGCKGGGGRDSLFPGYIYN